jgi:hypothetical protein
VCKTILDGCYGSRERCIATTNNRIQAAAVSAHATANKRLNHNPDEIKAMELTSLKKIHAARHGIGEK